MSDKINWKGEPVKGLGWCAGISTPLSFPQKTNCSRISGAMYDLSSCINELELMDPPLFGGPYTWRGGANQRNASRIDKLLYSFPWDEIFTKTRQSSLPSRSSDHNPIVLTCGDEAFKKSYFKFEKWWLNVEGFRDRVKEWWESFTVTGSPNYIIASKLSLLKKELKECSKENKGNGNSGSFEDIQIHRALTDDEQLLKAHLAMQYEELRKFLNDQWRIVIRSWVNQRSSGEFLPDFVQETERWRPSLNILDVRIITEEEQVWLSRDFEEEEVLEGINNDTVVFFEAEQEQICFLRVILVVFETCSGLKVNWRKSSIFPIKEVHQIEVLASILKGKVKKLTTIYIGLPLGSKHKAEKKWDGNIEKIEKKLAWKSQYPSLRRRVTLINSVLESLPTYVMSLYNKRTYFQNGCGDIIRRTTFRGGPMVWAWDFHVGGLKFETPCQRKQGEDQALWKEKIRRKFGQQDLRCTTEVTETNGVGVWKTIRNFWASLKNNSKIVVGRGNKAKFWSDDWCGNEILRDMFPSLFSICTNPGGGVLTLIGGFAGTTQEPNKLAWGHHKDRRFPVNRLYNWGLRGNDPLDLEAHYGKVWPQPRVVLNLEAMQKRGIIISRCLLYKGALETNKHLFMHCKVTAQVWAMYTSIANEHWIMPEHTSDLLSCWIKRGGSKSQKRWWRTVPACIWWIIWKERNQRIFEGK
ncbi:hypothetical protein H5410_041355 [Solanum commersonii]|uniref:Reverse transcriptase zinc-binding domain-containing protein n=1 Tax=Solanum commersonii TaxID=4109 RepID=A0A9J5XRL0_SOLCO|nr:hypothetical protein H5410_041355 [Solanum commersonii]